MILVTGNEGFIGRALQGRLEDMGYEVNGVDKASGYSTAAFESFLAFARVAAPTTIVHCGASCSTPKSLREPRDDFTDNVIGTFNVCEVARRVGARVIFLSSVKVHPGADGLVSPYGQSKRTGEQYMNLYSSLYGVPTTIVRPSTVYGPTQNGSSDGGWFTWFIRAAHEGKPIVIHGDGHQTRDVLYIDDFINLLVAMIQHFPRQGIYEVGGGADNEVSLLDLLDVLDYRNVTFQPPLPADLHRVVQDNFYAWRQHAWKPSTNWREGMKRVQERLCLTP